MAEISQAHAMPRGASVPRPPPRDQAPASVIGDRCRALLVALIAGALLGVLGWRFTGAPAACRPSDLHGMETAGRSSADSLAERIVLAESSGDGTARNELSSATGAGQFLDATWLEMIRRARPDLAGQSDEDILDLRRDPDLSREMVARFARRNAAVLASRCLPVTPASLYLSHFAGSAGAVALLSAPRYADAAGTMAKADSTGRTTRAMIVAANPFLARFTVADLENWADIKMRSDRSR
jgi:hypothetical protein